MASKGQEAWRDAIAARLLASVDVQVGGQTVDRQLYAHCVACGADGARRDWQPHRAFVHPGHWLCARCAPAYHAEVYRLLRRRLPAEAARCVVRRLARMTAYLNERIYGLK